MRSNPYTSHLLKKGERIKLEAITQQSFKKCTQITSRDVDVLP